LENNIAQTAGSAGESIAFGVGVPMPAIMILGFDLELTRVMLVAVLGGALGILMMIPLRRALIVKEHGTLKYPEGTACAEVLKAGASEESGRRHQPRREPKRHWSRPPDWGAAPERTPSSPASGSVWLTRHSWRPSSCGRTPRRESFGAPFKAGSVGMEISPELLGVGYIIGPRIASIMCSGGVLAYLVLIPLINSLAKDCPWFCRRPGKLIRDMSPNDIRSAYILYIGAGAVAAGGIISLIRSLPTIWHGLKGGLADLGLERRGGGSSLPRTERDLSMKFVGIGILALLAAITLARPLHMNPLGALLILLFGFLFRHRVVAPHRRDRLIVQSDSGMTVATLLLTCLVFCWLAGPAVSIT